MRQLNVPNSEYKQAIPLGVSLPSPPMTRDGCHQSSQSGSAGFRVKHSSSHVFTKKRPERLRIGFPKRQPVSSLTLTLETLNELKILNTFNRQMGA